MPYLRRTPQTISQEHSFWFLKRCCKFFAYLYKFVPIQYLITVIENSPKLLIYLTKAMKPQSLKSTHLFVKNCFATALHPFLDDRNKPMVKNLLQPVNTRTNLRHCIVSERRRHWYWHQRRVVTTSNWILMVLHQSFRMYLDRTGNDSGTVDLRYSWRCIHNYPEAKNWSQF